jgi:hypothetical protein
MCMHKRQERSERLKETGEVVRRIPVPRHGGYEEGRPCRPAQVPCPMARVLPTHKLSLGPETRSWKKPSPRAFGPDWSR